MEVQIKTRYKYGLHCTGLQGVPLPFLTFQELITLKICFFDQSMLGKPKCVWEVYILKIVNKQMRNYASLTHIGFTNRDGFGPFFLGSGRVRAFWVWLELSHEPFEPIFLSSGPSPSFFEPSCFEPSQASSHFFYNNFYKMKFLTTKNLKISL